MLGEPSPWGQGADCPLAATKISHLLRNIPCCGENTDPDSSGHVQEILILLLLLHMQVLEELSEKLSVSRSRIGSGK